LTTAETSHHLKKELNLRDVVQMQILLVVGVTWIGTAAKMGGVHLVFWLAAILTLFLPSAAVVTYCVRIWPQEGGVYQWTRHVFGPLAGFLNAWNFAMWALLSNSNLGIYIASTLAYALGPRYAWMGDNKILIHSLNIGLYLIIFVICVVGFHIGKYIAHFGTFTIVGVYLLLMVLLVYHPHSSAAHPHVSPQSPFSLIVTVPMLTMLSLNLFSKMALQGLTGLEQIAVFAGEIKNAATNIWKSAWIAAPVIAIIFILGTGSILTYIPANKVDLNGPVPQILATAFSGGPETGVNWGALLGSGATLALGLAMIAQYALIVAETSRLPMVAGWDGILPEWFTRLSPRFGTPVRSIFVICALSIVFCTLATLGADAHEALQLINVTDTFLYDIYFGMMFLIPLVVGDRFGKRPSLLLKIASASGLAVTLLGAGLSVFPIIDVPNPLLFGVKIIASAAMVNLVGYLVYRGSRRSATA
jgi:amino acid transporter